MKQKRNYRTFILIGCALLCVLAVVLLCLALLPVAVINGHAVSRAEFMYYLGQQRAETYTYYAKNYNVQAPDQTFWQTQYDGQTPLERAKQRALAACAEDHALMQLGEDAGIVPYYSFSQLQEHWKSANENRKTSAAQGGIVYGPVEYAFADYIQGFYSKLKLDLKEQLDRDEPVSDLAISEFYTKNASALFSLPHEERGASLRHARTHCDMLPDAEEESVRNFLSNITLPEFDASTHVSCAVMQEFCFGAESAQRDLRNTAAVMQAIAPLSPGQQSPLFETSSDFWVVYLSERKEGNILPLDEVKNRIRDILAEEKYAQRLAHATEHTNTQTVPMIYNMPCKI